MDCWEVDRHKVDQRYADHNAPGMVSGIAACMTQAEKEKEQ